MQTFVNLLWHWPQNRACNDAMVGGPAGRPWSIIQHQLCTCVDVNISVNAVSLYVTSLFLIPKLG